MFVVVLSIGALFTPFLVVNVLRYRGGTTGAASSVNSSDSLEAANGARFDGQPSNKGGPWRWLCVAFVQFCGLGLLVFLFLNSEPNSAAKKFWGRKSVLESKVSSSSGQDVHVECKHPEGAALLDIYNGSMLDQYNPRWIQALFNPLSQSTGDSLLVDASEESRAAHTLFIQGLVLIYGFNREEAIYNFDGCIQILDSVSDVSSVQFGRGLCEWGRSLTFAPNLNAKMREKDVIDGRAAVLAASASLSRQEESWLKLSTGDTVKVEEVSRSVSSALTVFRSLLTATEARFARSATQWAQLGQLHFDQAYADAMKTVYLQFPADDDVLGLYCDAVLNLSPWDYFQPAAEVLQIPVKVGESVVKPVLSHAVNALQRGLSLKHPLHLHLYVHITEQSSDPGLGLAAADALRDLSGRHGSDHLIHMPSHTYLRTGDYSSAISSSLIAIELDKYLTDRCLLPYVAPHNQAILVQAALSVGAPDLAVRYAPTPALLLDEYASMYVSGLFPLAAELPLVKLGRWREVLTVQRTSLAAVEDRGGKLQSIPAYFRAIHFYCRALALMHLKSSAENASDVTAEMVQQALSDLASAASSIPPALFPVEHVFYPYHAEMAQLMNVTAHVALSVLSETSAAALHSAVDSLHDLVSLQDSFSYMEPDHYYTSMRQCLGGALILLHRATEAEASTADLSKASSSGQQSMLTTAVSVFSKDLQMQPHNVWSLAGTHQALVALDETGGPSVARRLRHSMRNIQAHRTLHEQIGASEVLEELRRVAWSADTYLPKGPCCELGLC